MLLCKIDAFEFSAISHRLRLRTIQSAIAFPASGSELKPLDDVRTAMVAVVLRKRSKLDTLGMSWKDLTLLVWKQ